MDAIALSLDGLDPVLAGDLRSIAAEREAKGCPLTLEEAARLVRQADRIRLAAERRLSPDRALAHIPAEIPWGGLVLRKPTIAAQILIEQAAAWPELGQDAQLHFLCYVLHHANDWQALGRITTPAAARAALDLEFLSKLTDSEDSLLRAIRLLLHGEPDEADDDGTPAPQKKSPQTGPPPCSASRTAAAARPGTGSSKSRSTTPAPCSARRAGRKASPKAATRTARKRGSRTPSSAGVSGKARSSP